MKKLFLTIIFSMLVLSSAVIAQNAQLDFTIVNKTGLSIDQLYISPSDTDVWQEDILGVDILPNDQECKVSFSPGEEYCLWDMKIIDEEEDEIAWGGIDLCKAVIVTLYWAEGKAWAEIDEGE
ncbi:MAG: hypothetical protein R6W90_10720 [Ignavibacteriaceae bacterium]